MFSCPMPSDSQLQRSIAAQSAFEDCRFKLRKVIMYARPLIENLRCPDVARVTGARGSRRRRRALAGKPPVAPSSRPLGI